MSKVVFGTATKPPNTNNNRSVGLASTTKETDLDTAPMTLQEIEADVYYGDADKDRYYVKITFVGTGMYINSFSVQPSKYENQPYWVQPPKHLQRGKGWTPTVDFDKSYPIWNVIEHKALEAVKRYKQEATQDFAASKDDVIVDIPDGPITLDDIPF